MHLYASCKKVSSRAGRTAGIDHDAADRVVHHAAIICIHFVQAAAAGTAACCTAFCWRCRDAANFEGVVVRSGCGEADTLPLGCPG